MNILQQKIFAGAYKTWEETFSDYPATDYDFKYVLRKSTSEKIEIAGSVSSSNSTDFTLTVLPSKFTIHGDYNFQAIATDKTDADKIYVIGTGKVYIYPNLAGSTDPRCAERINADLIEDAIANWSGEFANVNLNGKSVQYKDFSELVKAYNFWNSRALVKEGRATKSKTKKAIFF